MIIDQLSNAQLLIKQQTAAGTIKVFENSLFRWLCLEDEQAIQSCMSKSKPAKLILPYQKFMMMWQLLSPDSVPMKACLLGLGGGDLIRYLQQHFPKMKLLAVEKEPQMAKLATEYFQIKPDQKHLTLEMADAEEFIKKTAKHDLLFIDIVANNVLPNFLSEISFWRDCHSLLNQNGIMVVNVIPSSENEFLTLLQMLRETFGHLPLCMGVPDHKNIVLLVPLAGESIPSLDELKRRSVELQQQSDLPYGQCVEVLERDNKWGSDSN